MNRKKNRQKLTRELSLAWTIFMTRFSRGWMNCTRTSSSLRLTYERRGSQVFGHGRIESKDSGKHCETFFKPQTRPTGSGIEETKESSTSSHRLGRTIDRCDRASSCKSIKGSSGFVCMLCIDGEIKGLVLFTPGGAPGGKAMPSICSQVRVFAGSPLPLECARSRVEVSACFGSFTTPHLTCCARG